MRYCIFFSLFFLYSCNDKIEPKKNQDTFIFCDAEEKIGNDFISGDFTLSGGNLQSSSFSKNGTYSVKLDESNPYGFSYSSLNIKKGDVIKVTSWKMSEVNQGSIVIDAGDSYLRNGHEVKKENGWGLVETYFYADQAHEEVKIFAYNPDSLPVYFDDFSISIYRNTKKPDNIENALVLNIPESAMDSIRSFRDVALSQGVLTSDLKQYFKSEILYKGQPIPVKLRLKGDWTDHLKSSKWSFRIKVRGNHSYDGLKSFSIQNPSTRGFMLEWFAHQLYEKEDILTTTYKFIPVIINGVNMGVYALEEHFDKQLLEARNRREAPIVKFDEGGVWQNHLYRVNHSIGFNVPVLQSAEILPFKKNRTYRTETLRKQFKIASQKMNQYRAQEDLLEDCFNEDAIAKYLALTDLINGKHSLIWHNQRFYFNPVMNRLEPIAYDCFTSLSELEYNPRLIGEVRLNKQDQSLSEYILNNPRIEEKYYNYLKEFLSDEYLVNALKDLEQEISFNTEMLNNEYPFIELNVDFFHFNRKELLAQLGDYKKARKENKSVKKTPTTFDVLPNNVIFTKVALSAYTISKSVQNTRLYVNNFHSSPIVIIGVLYKNQELNDFSPFKKEIRIKKYTNSSQFFEITVQGKPKRLVYKADNCGDSLFTKKISKWSMPEKGEVMKYTFTDDTILFEKGSYHYSSDLIIPEGKTVVFEKGVSMDFTNQAGFVSYSPVKMMGTSSEPVNIFSSDTTASGFTVIASGKEVSMNYCFFNGFRSMNKNNWILTGAVTIYEGKVELNNCRFENNYCEDALNIIRSHFIMKNCIVSTTTSDGFDADFCTGRVLNSIFTKTGNDCMDFSGSTIDIQDCEISESGDKGISGGEKSTLTIKNCSISNTSIGIASKDRTKVEVSKITLKNCNYAFAAYRKKPEFGPAEIVVYSVVENTSAHLFLLEKDSELIYLDKDYVGDKVFNIDSMYVQFEK